MAVGQHNQSHSKEDPCSVVERTVNKTMQCFFEDYITAQNPRPYMDGGQAQFITKTGTIHTFIHNLEGILFFSGVINVILSATLIIIKQKKLKVSN